jgi:hypothetical protein
VRFGFDGLRAGLTAISLALAGTVGAQAGTADTPPTRTATWQHYASQGTTTEGRTQLDGTPLQLTIERDGTRLTDVRVVLGGRRIAVPRSAWADLHDVDPGTAQVSYGTCCGRPAPADGATAAPTTSATGDDDYLFFGIRLALRGQAKPARYVQFQFARGSYAGRFMNDVEPR